MKPYESGSELESEIAKRECLFIRKFEDDPDDGWEMLIEEIDRTPRQIIAYQLGWMELLLSWEREDQADKEVATPAPSFKSNQLGDLYESFYQHWKLAPPRDLSNRFEVLPDEVIQLVPCLAESELFESKQRTWASSTPSTWPAGKCVHINTIAPLTTLRTKIRTWKKLDAC